MDVVERAVRAATAVAAGLGLRVDDPGVLADGANVVVHLLPSPVVAKVAATTHLVRTPQQWLERELRVCEHLASRGVPVVAPFDPRVHEHDGEVLTVWRHLPHEPDALAEPALLGSLLRDLHDALGDLPLSLPRLATPLGDVAAFLARTPHTGMSRAYDRLAAELGSSDGPALHGDPHPGNLLRTPGGWVWCDLEDACSGPIAWDLVCLDQSTRIDGAAAVRAYGGDVDLRPWRELRRLHATVWYALYAERLPRHRARAAELLAGWD